MKNILVYVSFAVLLFWAVSGLYLNFQIVPRETIAVNTLKEENTKLNKKVLDITDYLGKYAYNANNQFVQLYDFYHTNWMPIDKCVVPDKSRYEY